MHWIIQKNLHQDQGMIELVSCLDRTAIPYSMHKVIPFVGQIVPDINPLGPVIVIGSYSLRHVARAKHWTPGSFDLGHLTYADHVARWGEYMLNHDAVYTRFLDVPNIIHDEEPFFIRPDIDSKMFEGQITTLSKFMPWWHGVTVLEDDGGSYLRASTMVMVASPKTIFQEYRVWVVDGAVVTASLYKRGGRVFYDGRVDQDIIDFAKARADVWCPARAFVVDVARCEHGLYVIETNTFNAAGFYAADISKLVGAIESMSFADVTGKTAVD